ncbi:MAG: hypothetical protein JWM76_41 [Pseudonocardiales bacterium]|nr:hypothetical protein [Pseudonocardiales bacterium]
MSSWDPNDPVLFEPPRADGKPVEGRSIPVQHVYRPEDFPFGGYPGDQPPAPPSDRSSASPNYPPPNYPPPNNAPPNYPPPNYPPPNYPPYGYQPAPPLPSAFPTASAGGPATMRDRFLAKIIDGLVIVLPFAILLAWAMSAENKGVQTPISLAAFVANLAYETYFIAYKGATIGKRIRGIRVVDELTGGRLSPGRALLRSFMQYFSNYVLLASWWSPFLDRPKLRGWHDKAAKDVVITDR